MTNKSDNPPAQKDKEPTISLGNYLQLERQKKKLSIQEIAVVTKVPQEALTALESGNKNQLPVPVFAKGFLKIYSGYLGLDQNDILKRFQNEWGIDSCTNSPEMLHDETLAQSSPFYLSAQFYIIILVIALFLGLAFFFFNANDQSNQDVSLLNIREMQTLPASIIQQETPISISKINSPPEHVQQALISPNSAGKISREEDDSDDLIIASLPALTIVQKQPQKKLTAALPLPQAPASATIIKAQIDTVDHDIIEIIPEDIDDISASLVLPLDLHIAFLARTRISISQDEASPARYIFSSGEESRWSADKTISMQVEKAENIRITLNGKIIPLPKSQGSPLAITLPADLYKL